MAVNKNPMNGAMAIVRAGSIAPGASDRATEIQRLTRELEAARALARKACIACEGMRLAALKIQSIWIEGEMLLPADVQEVIDIEVAAAATDPDVLARVDKTMASHA